MIQVLNYPAENRYLLDGNNTQLTVTSSNGIGYYFRAKIYIDDVLFDEQGWSRKDDYTATKDLIYLYHAYFKPFFLGSFDTGLFEQIDFKKKVTIVIEERLIDNDAVVDSVTLPNFYLIYNVKSESFNDADKVYVLGLDPKRFRMKKTGTISIPFYVNAEDEDVSVVIKDDIGNILHQETIADVTGKKIYIYNLNLSEVTLLSAALYITADVTCGTETIQKVYSIIKLPNYDVNELVFQNNFGFYIPAYFDGDFEDKRGFSVQKYEQFNNSEKVFAIDEDGTYTINTGNLNIEEKEIVRQIANSLDCYFKNGAVYRQVITETKKATYNKSRENIFSEDLVFSFREGLPFTNDLNLEDVTPEIVITDVTTSDFWNYLIEFTSNFSVLQLFSQIRFNSNFNWSMPFTHSSINSPQSRIVSLGGGNFDIRLFASYNGQIVYSNIFTLTNIVTDIVTMPLQNNLSFVKSLIEVSNQNTAYVVLTEAMLFNGYSNTESRPYTKIKIISLPINGTITTDGIGVTVPVTVPLEIPIINIQSGGFKFWPIGNDGSQPYENFVTSFQYIVIDNNDNESDPVDFQITFTTV